MPIVARCATLKASVICAVGTKGSAIHMAAVIGKAIWKLRLCLMAFS